MVTGLRRLLHAGLPFRQQPGQKKGRLHLGARHRQLVNGPLKAGAGDLEGSMLAAVLPLDRRPHLSQRFDHPPHGPAADRIVSCEPCRDSAPRQLSQQKADGRAGISDVDRDRRGPPQSVSLAI